MKNYKPILLAEDDEVDAMTVKRALNDLNVTNQLVHTVNGEEALNYLKDDNNKKPCVVLLDLNMPRSLNDVSKVIRYGSSVELILLR